MTGALVVVGFVVAAALGTLARSEIGRLLNRGVAWGTVVVNVTGAAALGAVSALAEPWGTIVGTGGLGAYTTFSSFARDIMALLRGGRLADAALYVSVTLVAGIGAAWLTLALSS